MSGQLLLQHMPADSWLVPFSLMPTESAHDAAFQHALGAIVMPLHMKA